MDINDITEKIIGAAIEVHRRLGPGMLESAYQECLCHELKLINLSFNREIPMPIIYKEIKLDHGYRLDILVENKVVVELKSVDSLLDVHTAQILTYMRLGEYSTGLIINFNVSLLKNGIKRYKI
jgi:GxxExxY protein